MTRPAQVTAPSADVRSAHMTRAQKAGQVMMIGFDGTTLTPELRAAVTDLHVGGVVIFERNVDSPEGLARLISDLQALASANGDPPLLIAIDQEGGRVARLKEASGFTEFPSAMAVAATGNPENARRVARAVARELKAVGINVDLAPDLDVNNNPDNPVIGIRSFGSDPASVAIFGAAFAEGLQAEGVMAVGKHFPGHGDTTVDSHVALPSVPHERARLESTELVPFRAAMACSLQRPSGLADDSWGGHAIPGIMAAHITFSAIDPTPGLPATLSPRVLTGLLRDEMAYEGLIFTDALDMGALAQGGCALEAAAATALAAGADVLLFNHGHEWHRQAHALILDRLEHGQLPTSRLDEAVRRVLMAKARFDLRSDERQVREVWQRVGTAEHKALARGIAGQAITLLRDNAGLLPLASDARLLVIEPPDARGLGKALVAPTLPIEANPGAAEIRTATRTVTDGCTVVVATTNARQNPGQAQLVQSLLAARTPIIVVAVQSPYDLMAFPSAPTYLASFGANPPLLEALAAVLRGRTKPGGRLPVQLPGLYPAGAGLGDFAD
jgi:beta-N-acetylhexosaminidase